MKLELIILMSLCCCASLLNAAPLKVSGYASGWGPFGGCGNSYYSPNDAAGCDGDGYESGSSHVGDYLTGSLVTYARGYPIDTHDEEGNPIRQEGYASAEANMLIDQHYLLSGGTGPALLRFGGSLAQEGGMDSGGASSDITINGIRNNYHDRDYQVAFGSYLTIKLQTHVYAQGSMGNGSRGSFAYDLTDFVVTQNGNVFQGARLQPVPEPASYLCMPLGLAAIGAIRRSRKA